MGVIPRPVYAVENDSWSQVDMRQRTLRSVLSLYQRHGYNLFFSDDLVTSAMIIHTNPEAAEPIARLQSALSKFGLKLQQQPNSNTGYIIADPEGRREITFYLKDQYTRAPIVNALVVNKTAVVDKTVVDDKTRLSITSDETGKVILSLPVNSQKNITITHPGYNSLSINSNAFTNAGALFLVPHAPVLDEVVVTASTYRWRNQNAPSHYDISNDDIKAQPTRGGDVLQILNTLPGIASAGVSAKPNIRGGEDGELQILFDDVELIDPFHLKDFQSLISGINPSLVASMDMYTGGYKARFGSRMSGVLDIKLLEESDYAYELEQNFLATSGKASGTLSNEKVLWQLAGRRGNIDEVVDRFNSNIGTPRFSDVFGKLRWQGNESVTADLGVLSIIDDITLNLADSGESARSEYQSQYGWLKTNITHNPRNKSQWLLTYAQINNNREGRRIAANAEFDSAGELYDSRDFNLARLEYSNDQQLTQHQNLEWGAKIEYARGQYDYRLNATHGTLGQALGRPPEHQQVLSAEFEGVNSHAFLSYLAKPIDDLETEAGLRFDSQDFSTTAHHQLSPRLAAKYQLNESLSIKTNAGRFYQAPQITELDLEANKKEFYSPQKADHYVLGIQYVYDKSTRWAVELYQKRIFTPRPRYENLFDRYLLLPELASDRVYLTPLAARSKGIELRLDKTLTTNLNIWLSYSMSRAEDEFSEGSQLRSWDQSHATASGFLYSHGRWEWSAQAQWHSGWPITPAPTQITQTQEQWLASRNTAHLRDYLSINTRLTYQWVKPNSLVKAYLDFSNITNRKNIGGYRYLSQNNGDSAEANFVPEKQSLIPIFPVLGVQWQF